MVLSVIHFLEAIAGSKLGTFILDFVMMMLWMLLFFLALLAFNDGEMRTGLVASMSLGTLFYYLTLHKMTVRFSNSVARKISNGTSHIEKSFKKLLHSYIKK